MPASAMEGEPFVAPQTCPVCAGAQFWTASAWARHVTTLAHVKRMEVRSVPRSGMPPCLTFEKPGAPTRTVGWWVTFGRGGVGGGGGQREPSLER